MYLTKISALIMFLVIVGLYIFFVRRSQKGKVPEMRRMAGLDALNEAIGRATEMGKPVHFTTGGFGTLYDENGPQILAGIGLLNRVAQETARSNTGLVVSICQPDVYTLAEAVVSEAYSAAGKADAYRPDMVRFLSGSQFAYTSAVLGILQRERPAANIMMGMFAGESLILGEAGAMIGAIQIAGTANISQLPFFVTACDYCLIGEEIYAVGAYLSRDPVSLGGILGEDYAKIILLAIMAVGIILSTMGIKFVADILGM